MSDFTQGGKLYRRYDDGRIGYFRVKPVLRIGAYHHAWASEPLADFPLRLERNRDGIYYWSMARSGEYHWWLTVNSTTGPKTGENRVRVPVHKRTLTVPIKTKSLKIKEFQKNFYGGQRVGEAELAATGGRVVGSGGLPSGSKGRTHCRENVMQLVILVLCCK